MIGKFVSAASQVLLVSLIVGAGLPALFAVGVRSLAAGRVGGPRADAQSAGPGAGQPGGSRLATMFGIACIAVVLAAVALGITVIVAAGFGKSVSFSGVIPALVSK
jgi:hypothetical protein